MNKIEGKYNAFKSNIENVVQFISFMNMQETEISNPNSLELAKGVIHSSVPYNALIISLYGNIELFVDEIAQAYIEEMYKLVGKYQDLPQKMREKHELISGEFLCNPNRFNNFDTTVKDVVSNLNDCLQDNKGAKINMEMLLKHGGNLKSEQTFRFFTDLGVDNIQGKFLKSKIVIEEYANQKELSLEEAKKSLSERNQKASFINLFKELDDLVDQRNQVAHSGKVDGRKAFDYIENTTVPFLLLFGKVISDILINEILDIMIKRERLNKFLEVKNVFNNEIIWLKLGSNSLSVGDKIIFKNNDEEIGWCKVESIRINDEEVSNVDSSVSEEATIKVDKKVKLNWTYYKYSQL